MSTDLPQQHKDQTIEGFIRALRRSGYKAHQILTFLNPGLWALKEKQQIISNEKERYIET